MKRNTEQFFLIACITFFVASLGAFTGYEQASKKGHDNFENLSRLHENVVEDRANLRTNYINTIDKLKDQLVIIQNALIDYNAAGLDINTVNLMSDTIENYSIRPNLMRAFATVESNNNPKAYNKISNARGLYQITPICHKDVTERIAPYLDGNLNDLFDPIYNTEIATAYIYWLSCSFRRLDYVIIAYHWGYGNAIKWDGKTRSLPNSVADYYQRVSNLYIKYEFEEEQRKAGKKTAKTNVIAEPAYFNY